MLELALVRYAMEKLIGEGFEPVIPPVLVRERGAVRHRHASRHRAADLPRAGGRPVSGGTSEVALASLHREEILAGDQLRCATPGSPPASGARPAPPARTPAASSGCTSSTRSRCSPTSPPSRPAPSTSGCWRSRSRSCRSWRSRTAWWRSPSTTSAPPRPEVRRRGVAPGQGRYRELTSCSDTTDYQARRLDIRYRGADGKPATPHPQRDRGRGRADDHRAARERPAGGRVSGAPAAIGGIGRARASRRGRLTRATGRASRPGRRGSRRSCANHRAVRRDRGAGGRRGDQERQPVGDGYPAGELAAAVGGGAAGTARRARRGSGRPLAASGSRRTRTAGWTASRAPTRPTAAPGSSARPAVDDDPGTTGRAFRAAGAPVATRPTAERLPSSAEPQPAVGGGGDQGRLASRH